MTDEIRRLLLDIVLLDSELDAAPSLEDMARRAKAELDRAALAPESGQGEPDPKVLEITERDRWAWRLGWATAMSERTGRTFNPSDAPEPPAPSSPSSAQGVIHDFGACGVTGGCAYCKDEPSSAQGGLCDECKGDGGTTYLGMPWNECPKCGGTGRAPSLAGGGA